MKTEAEFLREKCIELEAENANLREALEKITRTYGSAGATAIARTALVETDHDDLWESWLGDAND